MAIAAEGRLSGSNLSNSFRSDLHSFEKFARSASNCFISDIAIRITSISYRNILKLQIALFPILPCLCFH